MKGIHPCPVCGNVHGLPPAELDFASLKSGDIVRNRATGLSYILHDRMESTKPETVWWLAVRTVVVSNPSEWVKE